MPITHLSNDRILHAVVVRARSDFTIRFAGRTGVGANSVVAKNMLNISGMFNDAV